MYDDALYAGIRPGEFHELSYGEICAAIKAHNRREAQRAEEWRLTKEANDKYLATLVYRGAALVANMCFSKHPPDFEAAFPEFKAESAEVGDENETETIPKWKRQQAGMTAWVDAYNARVRRNKGATNGR